MLILFFIFISLINSFICLKSEQSAQLFLQKSSKSSSKHSWNSSLILKAFYRKRAIFKNLTNFSWSVFKSLSASVFDNSSLKNIPQKFMFLKNNKISIQHFTLIRIKTCQINFKWNRTKTATILHPINWMFYFIFSLFFIT